MPRTEFNAVYQQVKSKIPGDLFALFNILACYTIDQGTVVVDTAYCEGPLSNPVPNDKFGALSYTNPATNPPATVNIKSWIQGIGNGSPSPDELSKFDESIDGSIGGLGDKLENMYDSQRAVPLFEFRDLFDIVTTGIEDFMTEVDSAIQTLHKDFADPPKKKKRDVPASCTMSGDPAQTSSMNPTSVAAAPTQTSSASPTPVVVAPVDPPSQPTCAPTPTSHVKDSHEGELQKAAQYFCDKYASDTNAQGPIDIKQTIIAGTKTEGRLTVDIAYPYPPKMGNQDDVYDISLTSVPNCTPSGDLNLATPAANNKCSDILHSAWKQCINQGRGGAIRAGCLDYGIYTRY